jgi:hypothetical protein
MRELKKVIHYLTINVIYVLNIIILGQIQEILVQKLFHHFIVAYWQIDNAYVNYYKILDLPTLMSEVLTPNLNYVDSGTYTSTENVWDNEFVLPNMLITSPGKGFKF